MADSRLRTCTVDGCSSQLYCKGFCVMHYNRWRTTGSPGPAARLRAKSGQGSITDEGYRVLHNASHPPKICVDHVDENRLNNNAANLVPSCLDCNTKRAAA